MARPGNRIACLCGAALIVGLAAGPSRAQTSEDPVAQPPCPRRGRIHRMFHHVAHTAQDKFVGYPDTFVEPPMGYYVNEQMAVQVAKANTHRFMLYRTDFLPGTSEFSPAGASRFNIMAARIPGWMGPVVIEWTPDNPTLAEERRATLLATMQKAGMPILADRVVIGPSPYPGAMGVEAVNHAGNTIMRNAAPAPMFPLPPTETAASGVH
jgi:hypothetical protein